MHHPKPDRRHGRQYAKLTSRELRIRITQVLLLDSSPLRWALGWTAVMFAFGLLTAETKAESYSRMLSVAPMWAWAVLFTVYGFGNLLPCLVRTDTRFRLLNGMVGLSLWGTTLVSFWNASSSPISALGLVLVVFTATEVWLSAEVISRISRNRGGGNA